MSTMSKNHYIIPIFVPMEGCPHQCVFCNQDKITNSDEEKVDGQFVRDTIEEYISTIQNKDATIEVSFFGGTFTGIPIEKQNELLAVAKEYKDKCIIDKIHMSTRPDYIDVNILDNLKRFDVDVIELGVQSLDEEVLRESGRGHSVEDVIRASKLINDYGITLGHQIMLGLPSDTEEKDIYSVKESIKMNPKIARIYPSLVITDTPMAKMFKRGTYEPYSLEKAVDVSKILYKMYKEAGVNVIRIGLQPTENISEGGDVIAGPFHSAFRELVDSSIISDEIIKCANENDGDINIYVNNNTISKIYADKKRYFLKTKESLKDRNIKVSIDNTLEKNVIKVEINDKVKFIEC